MSFDFTALMSMLCMFSFQGREVRNLSLIEVSFKWFRERERSCACDLQCHLNFSRWDSRQHLLSASYMSFRQMISWNVATDVQNPRTYPWSYDYVAFHGFVWNKICFFFSFFSMMCELYKICCKSVFSLVQQQWLIYACVYHIHIRHLGLYFAPPCKETG